MAPHPSECRSAGDVQALVEVMYGDATFSEVDGVAHVTALWESPGGPLVTLKVNENSPKSAYDAFALNVARARADAIVVTGRILREEPNLRYELFGDGELPKALACWRREVRHRVDAPRLLILTSGRDLPLEHPALHSWARPLLFVPADAPAELGARAARAGVEVVTSPHPDLRSAVDHLRDSCGARTISIEAGPSTSRSLYDPPLAVDQLALSLFRGPRLPEGARGPALLDRPAVEAVLLARCPPFVVQEPSGPWSFELLTRAQREDAAQ